MLVSLKWLANYIDLPMEHEELEARLSFRFEPRIH